MPAPSKLFLPQRWMPVAVTIFTLLLGVVAAGFGYLGSQQIVKSIDNDLLLTYPTLHKVYQLIHLVEDTKSCFEDVHPDMIYLESEISYYEERFLLITQEISDPGLFSMATSIRDTFSLFTKEGLVYQRLKHNGVEDWVQAHQVSLRSEELQVLLEVFRDKVIDGYRNSLDRIGENTRLFNSIFGFLSLIVFAFGMMILWGLRYFLNELETKGEQLMLALEQAEEGDRAKSQFMAVISHEIRTPMNGVIGMAELLQQSKLSTIQKQYVKTILQSADTQLHLIGNILDMSKLDAKSMNLECEPFQVRQVLENSVLQMIGHAEEKGLKLELQVPPTLPLLHRGDQSKLSQIMTNLLNNAIKFTHQGSVVVSVDQRPLKRNTKSQLTISVTDSGIGIPRNKRKTIFNRFVQADNSTTRRFGGTGLGLSICRDLSHLMGGRIELDTNPLGGSIFKVHLPLEIESVGHNVPMAINGKKILVSIPNPVMEQYIAEQLQHWGFLTEVLTTTSLREAREHPLVLEHDAFICDSELFEGTLASELTPFPIPVLLMAPSSELESLDRYQVPKGLFFVPYPAVCRSILIQGFLDVFPKEIGKSIEAREELSHSESHGMISQEARWDSKLKVLMVEDNPTNQVVAREMFGSLWITIDIASHGRQALEMFPKKNYDIVFMDLLMPEMDGFEATQKIRDMEGLAEHLPIIALTANVSDEDRDLCFKAGMNEILPKPVRLAELSNCLDRWLPETLRLTPHSSSTEVVAVGSDHSRSSQRQEILSPQIEQVQDLKQSQDIEQHQGVEELDVQYGTDAQNDVMDLKPFAIFDFDSVLKITGGRDDIAQKVIQAFLSNVSNNFDALRKTIEEKHVSNCRREAHTLKSSAAYAGHIRLSELSKALEAKCCGDQFPDQATDFLISMRRAHEAFLKELKSSKPDWV